MCGITVLGSSAVSHHQMNSVVCGAHCQLPDVGVELTGGCSGLSTKYLHWEEDLIVGGAYHGKTGQLRRYATTQCNTVIALPFTNNDG